MASGKEIRTQIKSVKSTQKITRAMEMVAASKMRKAQQRMHNSRPYAEKIRQVIGHLANARPEYKTSYMEIRDVKRVGVIIISSDRGLCGGLNTNLFKIALKEIKALSKDNLDLCTIGTKAGLFFSRIDINIVADKNNLGAEPQINDLIGAVKVMLDAYDSKKIDKLVIVYNKFINTMKQDRQVMQLLPIVAADNDEFGHHWDYIYEPSSKEVLEILIQRYIESQVYQAVVENMACEQAARMVAMKSASDNAGDLIKELQLAYNKARQAAITQELSEIVAGAAAV
jgi:F-type H+-transporting ATPase subunit gamma